VEEEEEVVVEEEEVLVEIKVNMALELFFEFPFSIMF